MSNSPEKELALLRTELRKPFVTAFMDGRNEHGTHLLIMPPSNVGGAQDSDDVLQALRENFERIFADAENLGHKQWHAIAITLRYIQDEHSYYEYEAVSPVLTAAFFGEPAVQAVAMSEVSHA